MNNSQALIILKEFEMKHTTLMLFCLVMLFTLTQCKNNSADTLSSDADIRAKTISALVNNDAYMNQVMDSMRTKHPDAILSAIFIVAKNDKQIQEKLMNNLADMCKMDTSMTKMMSRKTMNMLDDSKLDCCATGKMLMSEGTAMRHDDESDCCKKGKMIMGKPGKMSSADKLACCMAAAKKSITK